MLYLIDLSDYYFCESYSWKTNLYFSKKCAKMKIREKVKEDKRKKVKNKLIFSNFILLFFLYSFFYCLNNADFFRIGHRLSFFENIFENYMASRELYFEHRYNFTYAWIVI